MPDPTGPQFDPQPGDTMSDTSDDMYTYTVTSVEGDGDPNHTWVHSTHPDGTSDGGWSLEMWAEDCDGRFVYARPASRGARTATSTPSTVWSATSRTRSEGEGRLRPVNPESRSQRRANIGDSAMHVTPWKNDDAPSPIGAAVTAALRCNHRLDGTVILRPESERTTFAATVYALRDQWQAEVWEDDGVVK